MTSIDVCVNAICSNQGEPGAPVTVTGSIGGSGTTASSGGACCTIAIADPGGDGLSPPGPYTISASGYRYLPTSQSFSFANHTNTCSVVLDLSTPSDCYSCCTTCPVPANWDSMTLSTPWGGTFTVQPNTSTTVLYNNALSQCSNPPGQIDAEVIVYYLCYGGSGRHTPSIVMYFKHACKNFYGGASENARDGASIGSANIIWDVSCPDFQSGTFTASGSYDFETDPNYTEGGYTISQYFLGDYTLTENACGSVSNPYGTGGSPSESLSRPGPDHQAATSPIEASPRVVANVSTYRPNPASSNRKIRVGLWCPCLGMGGAEVWMLSLARHCDTSAIEWAGCVITERDGHIYEPVVEALGAFMPIGRGLDDARILAESCDVILSWSNFDLRPFVARLAHRPTIVHVAHFDPSHAFGDELSDWLAPADRWIAVSPIAREWIHPRHRDKASIIMNAVEPSKAIAARSRAEVRRSWGVPEGATVIGYLSRFERDKGADALVKLDRDLPAGFWIVGVGAGSLLGSIRSGASGRMVLPGPEIDSGSALAAFDRLIVPARGECFGLTLAEGLSFGVPVLASRAGLAAMVPGLVREIDPEGESLAASILDDLSDIQGTADRVARGRAYARDHLSIERFAREWSDAIVEASKGRKPSNDFHRLAMLAELCPFGSGPCGCGGGPPRDCSRPDRPDKVRRADCLACVAEGPQADERPGP